MKHYMSEHLCLCQVIRNKRVMAHVVVKKLGDVIAIMHFIRPHHLKVMVRKKLGLFITNKVCKKCQNSSN